MGGSSGARRWCGGLERAALSRRRAPRREQLRSDGDGAILPRRCQVEAATARAPLQQRAGALAAVRSGGGSGSESA